jgi:nucleotide-binding universal stress UspA family protein
MAAIVVGLDSSSDSTAALEWAAAEARQRDATLVVVHAYFVPIAYEHDDALVAAIDPALHQQAESALDEIVREAGTALDGIKVVRRLHPGRAAPVLIAESAAADLLVVGRRGARGFEGLVLGSTAEHCAWHAPGTVVVVPAPLEDPRGRIVVGVDGSSRAVGALRWAADLAARRNAVLEVCDVYEPYDAPGPFGGEFMTLASPASEERFRRRAEQRVAQALNAVDVPPDLDIEPRIEGGHPAEILIERSASADLVAVGSRGLGGLAGLLLGSVSRQLMHHAHSAVAIVR